MMNMPKKVIICEVGPRDGLQNVKTSFTVEQKIELIERSVDAGAKIVEVGSFVHPKAIPQMADTDEVCRRLRRVDGVEYRALVMNQKGLERAEASGIRKVKLTASASRAHSLSNMNRTPEEVVQGFGGCAEYAAAHGLELSGAISTSFGCPFDGKPVPMEQVFSVAECFRKIGVKELSLSDTTGMANPQQVFDYATAAKMRFPDVAWVLHFQIRVEWDCQMFWQACWPVWTGTTPVSQVWAAARSRRGPPGISPPKMWCTCWKKWVLRQVIISLGSLNWADMFNKFSDRIPAVSS